MVRYTLRLSYVKKGVEPWLQRQTSDGVSDEILIDCSLGWAYRASMKVLGAKEIYKRIYIVKPKARQKYVTIISGKGRNAKRYSFAIGRHRKTNRKP